MAQPANPPVVPDMTPSITLPEQPLAGEISDYINHLSAQHAHVPLALNIKIHPLNIAEGLAREFAAHERELAAGEKSAAHECADPCHPLENAAVRHELCNLIAEMTAPIADATLAHHLLFFIMIGRNLPPPFAADDNLALCASFDAKRRCMRQRFAPQRETAPPPGEAIIESGMTLVCEPLETGYYRIPDDDRHRSASGLLMGDPLYCWTMQTLLTIHLALANYMKLSPDERETVSMQLAGQLRSLFRLLALSHSETISYASLGGLNWVLLEVGLSMRGVAQPVAKTLAPTAPQTAKIVRGSFAGPMGAVHARSVEHPAATQILERNTTSLHHPDPRAHAEETTLQPE